MTKLLLAAGAAAALLAAPAMAGAQGGQTVGQNGGGKTKFSVCHRTGATTQLKVEGETAPVTVNQGVVINIPVETALKHVEQHGDIPLGPQVLRSGTKCPVVATTGNVFDEQGKLVQRTRAFLESLLADPELSADAKRIIQALLNKLS